MTKLIRELNKGDTFLDSFGSPLRVQKVVELPWLGVPRTKPKHRVYFETPRGNLMYQAFNSDREVEIIREADYAKN